MSKKKFYRKMKKAARAHEKLSFEKFATMLGRRCRFGYGGGYRRHSFN